MNCLKGLCLLGVCVFFVVESSTIKNRDSSEEDDEDYDDDFSSGDGDFNKRVVRSAYQTRQEDLEETCSALIQCTNDVVNFSEAEEEVPTFLSVSDEEVLDKFCGVANEQEECVDSQDPSECPNQEVVLQVGTSVAVANYICSEEGRAATLELAQSVCVDDEIRQLEVAAGTQLCTEQFEYDVLMLVVTSFSTGQELDTSLICPYKDVWFQCVTDAATDRCGQAYGTFVSRLLDIGTSPHFDSLGCGEQVTEKRRALELAHSLVAKRGLRSSRAV